MLSDDQLASQAQILVTSCQVNTVSNCMFDVKCLGTHVVSMYSLLVCTSNVVAGVSIGHLTGIACSPCMFSHNGLLKPLIHRLNSLASCLSMPASYILCKPFAVCAMTVLYIQAIRTGCSCCLCCMSLLILLLSKLIVHTCRH